MRSPYFFFGIFAFIGIPCLLLALYFSFAAVQKITTWETTDGIVVDDSDFPRVNFNYNGKAYEFETDYKNNDIHTGDTIGVTYPPGKPEEAETASFYAMWFAPLILAIFGISFGGIGVYGIVTHRRKMAAKDELFTQARGKKLAGLNASVSYNTSFKVNGRSPYIISAQWTDPFTQINYTFTSENIWDDPSSFIHDNKVDVYIDEANPKRYYVDITFLPK